MASLAREAGLNHLIAPVRPSLKDRYPTIPLERYARWTAPTDRPSTPGIRVHTLLGIRIGPVIPHSLHITGTVQEWESWTQMRFPRPVTMSSRPAWPPSTSTANAIWASTGNPTSGSSTRLARRQLALALVRSCCLRHGHRQV